MKQRIIYILFLSLISIISHAQVAMGSWRTHFAFNAGEQITQSDNKVFAVSEGKLFSVDKRDKSVEYYSKLSGLSGNYISNIDFDTNTNTLLIIYEDGNIDFMNANGVKNLPDFYLKQMSADKSINHILFLNDRAYLSAKFGIIVLNMQKMEIQDTYYIGNNATDVNVLSTTTINGNIYAVSESDIYKADLASSNLINFENWEKLSNLPGSGKLQAIHTLGDWLILKRNNRLYKMNNSSTWSALDNTTAITHSNSTNDYLMGFKTNETFYYDKQLNKHLINDLEGVKQGIYDIKISSFWLIGNNDGLILYNPNSQSTEIFKPEGPASNIAYSMTFAGEKLFVVQGGRWDVDYNRSGVVMIYKDNTWTNIREQEIISMMGHNRAKDFMSVAVDPQNDSHFYVTSYGNGVIEFREDKPYKWHNFENSTIQTIFPDNANSKYNYMRMDGGKFDNDGNLWFANSGVSNTIKVLKNNTSWTYLSNEIITRVRTVGDLLINNNQKWLLSARSDGALYAIDDNGTLDNTNDDKYKVFRALQYPANEGIQSTTPNFYYSIVLDKKGAIWFGTDMGPFIINNPSKAFDSDFLFSRIIIPRNDGTGLGDFLLEDQEILSIAVDGGNRKWIGTKESGVYLLSENGLETIHHFTVENSPLPSNEISSIAINPITGEVFFGTSGGLISYQSDAAEANLVFKDVHAYPNPVRENFKGVVTITGLIDKTNVKITDSTGNLVFETKSNGSIATWDMNNKYGQKVSTGVYLAICTTPDNSESKVVKILVIN